MNAPTPLIRPDTRGFRVFDGRPRLDIPLEDYSVRLNDFTYFEISGNAVLHVDLYDTGLVYWVELIEVHAPSHAFGAATVRVLSNDSHDADTADEQTLFRLIKSAMEADDSIHEIVREHFTVDDYRHNGEDE